MGLIFALRTLGSILKHFNLNCVGVLTPMLRSGGWRTEGILEEVGSRRVRPALQKISKQGSCDPAVLPAWPEERLLQPEAAVGCWAAITTNSLLFSLCF